MTGHVLVVDDDQAMCETLEKGLARRGFDIDWQTSADRALEDVLSGDFDVVLADLEMRGMSGLALCERISVNRPAVPVIVITAFGSMETAISAIRAGAYDFVTKPVELDTLAMSLGRAVGHRRLQQELARLEHEVTRTRGGFEMVGDTPVMRRLYDLLDRVADSDATVMIEGETGSGKELVARALHARGGRSDGEFVAINCAAMPESLLESELFGYAKGAFTDARNAHAGLFVRATGGTLFLDEIGDMPISLQAKLLRAVQERTVRPVGGTAEVAFDVRLIAATNRNLEAMVEAGAFRRDLFFRLNVIRIRVPPLRERRGDVLTLAQHFLRKLADQAGKDIDGISVAAARQLLAYHWPRNVRELQNCIEHAVALTRHRELMVEDLPESLASYHSWRGIEGEVVDELIPLAELERQYILHVLDVVGGNKRQAARVLELDRATLYRKLAKYAMDER